MKQAKQSALNPSQWRNNGWNRQNRAL